MAGDSLHRDLAEVLEFYNEPERLGLSAADLARYLIAQLAALTDALRALPTKDDDAAHR